MGFFRILFVAIRLRMARTRRQPPDPPPSSADSGRPRISHQNLRPQLSQAFRRLYGTAQHKGILTGLAILKLYCDCLSTTWTGNPARDPIVFFRTADMANSTSKWQRLPAEFDKNQAKAYSFTHSDRSANLASNRLSGLGPIRGRPP